MIDLSKLRHGDTVEATINNFRLINASVYITDHYHVNLIDGANMRKCFFFHDGAEGTSVRFYGAHPEKYNSEKKFSWAFYLVEDKNGVHMQDPRIEILAIKRKQNDNKFTPRKLKSFSFYIHPSFTLP